MAEIAVVICASEWDAAIPDAEALIARAVKAAEAELDQADTRSVAIALVDDAHQRALNARHRGKDAPTNVLAFPAGQSAASHLGDIVLALETVREEARARGLSLSDHVAHLAVHGFLHLLGYDHDDDRAAKRMEALETRALAAIGVRDPYREEFDA